MTNKQTSKDGFILVTEPDEISVEGVNLLISHGYQIIYTLDGNDANQVIGLFVRTYTKATKDFLGKFSNLKFILRAGVGLDNIDLQECKARGIEVYHSPGANKQSVAEYILTMALYMLRKIAPQTARVSNNSWRDLNLVGTGLNGKTIGLIGCGNVGRDLVRQVQPFHVKYLGYDPYLSMDSLRAIGITKSDLPGLYKSSDIIAVMLPLTAETQGIIDQAAISQMKQDAILINVSRGEIIDEQSLIQALASAKLGGAVLDVIKGEPGINPIFHNVPNLIITPHIAGFTVEANIQIALSAVTNFIEAQNL